LLKLLLFGLRNTAGCENELRAEHRRLLKNCLNAGSAAEAAATRKAAKYAVLERTHIFQTVAVENLGTMNASAYGFLAGLGRKISAISGDDRETSYLFQRISFLIQRFNATLLHESFTDENRSDD